MIVGFASDKVYGWVVDRLVLSSQPGLRTARWLLEFFSQTSQRTSTRGPISLLLVDVMRADGGDGSADVAALVVGLDRMAVAGTKVVNLSLAGPDHAALRRAVEKTVKLGVTLVAAVGNEGPAAPPTFPAAYSGSRGGCRN